MLDSDFCAVLGLLFDLCILISARSGAVPFVLEFLECVDQISVVSCLSVVSFVFLLFYFGISRLFSNLWIWLLFLLCSFRFGISGVCGSEFYCIVFIGCFFCVPFILEFLECVRCCVLDVVR